MVSMVQSWITGCMLLITWLHTGFRVTYNLVTGSHSIAHVFADSDEVSRFLWVISSSNECIPHCALPDDGMIQHIPPFWGCWLYTPFYVFNLVRSLHQAQRGRSGRSSGDRRQISAALNAARFPLIDISSLNPEHPPGSYMLQLQQLSPFPALS